MPVHNIEPFYDENSKILILGSFPSVKSRQEQFFYAYRQNRFWKVLAEVCGTSAPQTVSEKKQFLKENGIALWDVIYSCDISGSSDSSIRNVVPTDLSVITEKSEIRAVFLNGGASYSCYLKYQKKNNPDLRYFRLPSTSPANARYTLDDLYEEWKIIRDYL